MRDIANREDILTLMKAFYSKALVDENIGFFFTEVVPLQMEVHLPLIANFWETILFDRAAYKGNVLEIHRHIHQLSAFTDAHFQRWLALFKSTVDENFSGDRSELAKQRAESIATIMRLKTIYNGQGLH